jgi:hypothetical protein
MLQSVAHESGEQIFKIFMLTAAPLIDEAQGVQEAKLGGRGAMGNVGLGTRRLRDRPGCLVADYRSAGLCWWYGADVL